MPTVLIGGGTGMIGQRLSDLLHEQGYTVLHLSRKQSLTTKYPAYAWNVEQETVNEEIIQKADYLINLAGAGIADKPWTAARKKVITESRVKSTRLLKKAILQFNPNLNAYLSASAIGYYGIGAMSY
ncbi:MAG: NAD-dependent epimerase/dehydratase family protein [Saprospiraceae bacterium]|nr:NAD-dependent epimerase/dehydratase family protein [Saprospiraceae bacterium]